MGLQQLCATLPQGEAEVWLGDGQVNIALHWNPEEKTDGSPLCSDSQPVEKPSRQLKSLQQLLGYLQLHYVFRYNRLTDRTECACLAGEPAHELRYQPTDNRILNSISLQAMQAGISCWDRDIKRYVESAEIPSFHPFTSYMEHLPQWDGVDRVSPLARRVSDDTTWVNSFHRWMVGKRVHTKHGNGYWVKVV